MSRIVEAPLDPVALRASMRDRSAGALVVFEGWVRDHHAGRQVTALSFDCHVSMAEAQLQRILDEVRTSHPGANVEARHRFGPVALEDLVVWVGAAAAHREQAFAACREVIERIKDELPIWKLETYGDGSTIWQHQST